MAWNPAGQVTSRTISNGLYVYAPANGNTPYAIDGRNEIVSSGSTTFSYDANRNLTNDGASSFTYDAGNRLLSAGGQAYNYTPTGELYRVGARSLAHVDGRPVSLHTTSSGAVYRRFLPGPNENETVLYYVGVDTADRRWVVEDHLGSNIGYPNASGVPTIINTFDEYGQTGPGNTTYLQFGGQFMPTVASGVVYARNRFYRPRLGRFLQTDPILYGDGLNLYAYVGNDPVNRVDPTGTQSCPASGGCPGDPLVARLLGSFEFMNRPLPVTNPSHRYEIQDVICIGDQCNINDAFDCLLRNPAPGGSGRETPVQDRERANVSVRFAGLEVVQGGVEHRVFSDTHTIQNIALLGHDLYPGVVTRSLHSSTFIGHNFIFIKTVGTGSGPNGIANNVAAPFVWGVNHARIASCTIQ